MRDREEVQTLMSISTTQFYHYYNKINANIQKDFRRYKIRNPHFKTPEWMLKDSDKSQEEPKLEDIQELEELYDLQARYINLTGKDLPNRYKNNTERLLSKINQYEQQPNRVQL